MKTVKVNNINDLPIGLQELIICFERARDAWEDEGEPEAYLKILVRSDACISAEIYSMFRKQPQSVNVDKVKMMALKAKALKLKWKQK